MAYDPDKVNEQVFGETPGQGAPVPQSAQKEAQPISQDDAIILADTKEEFDYEPVPPGWYDSVIEKVEFGKTGPSAKKPNSPKMNFTFKLTGPQQAGRFVWFNIAPRSGNYGAISLRKIIARAMKADAKGEYHALMNYVDPNVKFDEKKFCDEGIAIGAEVKILVGPGKAYKKKTGANAGKTVIPDDVKDIAISVNDKKFME